MPKLTIVIKQTQTVKFDSGDVPASFIREMLEKRMDATFDGNWSPGDFGNDEWTTDSIDVIEDGR